MATGENFADALSAAAVAGEYNMPIVLTDGKTLSEEAKSLLENEDVYVLEVQQQFQRKWLKKQTP